MTTDEKQTRPLPFPPRNQLTATETEILELVAQGYTARETAGKIDLGIRTVERHIESLRLKMNARNTAHLVACAFSKGALRSVRGVARASH